MAEISLRPSSNGGTMIVVPAKYADRFRDETLFALGTAAQAIEEVAKWSHAAKERGEELKAKLTADDLQNYREAETVFVEAQAESGGDLTVEGSAPALRSVAVGCLFNVAEAIKEEVDRVELADLDPLMDEFGFWRSMRERFEASEGQS
jgi:hypothetical protein